MLTSKPLRDSLADTSYDAKGGLEMAASLRNVNCTHKKCAPLNVLDTALSLLFIGTFIFGIIYGSHELSEETFSFFTALLIMTKYVVLLCTIVLLKKIVLWLTSNYAH